MPTGLKRAIALLTCMALLGGGATLAFASGGTTTTTTTVSASDTQYGGGQGCTPGFWKNHTSVWQNYSTAQYFDEVFGVGPHITLLEALNEGGGAFDALDRHAVSALLNSQHENVGYELSTEEIIKLVQHAYATNDPEPIKNELAAFNESECSIDAHGNPITTKN